MSDIDIFASSLLEEAKRFLEIASASEVEEKGVANLHAALMLAFCAFEAHVNAICEEFAHRSELTPHERAILLEQEVFLEDGEFKLGGLKISRLEDRLVFLHKRFSGKGVDKSGKWWGALSQATRLRNRLTHPKGAEKITTADVSQAIEAIVQAIDALYVAIYKKNFPAAKLGLQSKLTF